MSRGARRRQRQQPRTLQVFLIIVLILLTACVAVKAFFLKAPEQKVDELPSQLFFPIIPRLSVRCQHNGGDTVRIGVKEC